MDFKKSQIPSEQLPDAYQIDYLNTLAEQIQSNESLTKSDLYEKLELLLVERTKSTDEKNRKINPKKITENRFILAQFYFDSRRFKKAHDIFDAIKASYYPAMFQLGIILYDDLLDRDESEDDQKSTNPANSQVDSEAAFRHPNREKWSRGFEYMLQIANLPLDEVNKKLIHQAQFNVGKAYFLGFGCKQSDQKAEEFWVKSADNGSEYGNVTAMTYLAFFYSRKSEPEFFNLDKTYFWHNEACGNGSLESQGALGAMYYYGIGCKKDYEAAYECLTNSSERGNVFSMGLLCDYYYRNKFYVKATELAKKVSELNDIDKISRETNCLRDFICKGIGLACFTLARCYEMAKGIEKDTNKALYLYKRVLF
ncbi:LRP2-binding -like [Brachionus plicatilis]|uniref:LRP2-binding protein n=1 Tax=Brachionus plicatilis TaxID=10195 RepID=A0A3M7RIW5_BRAPC|nr:LRP2-binding -like [Brachionus plicatilis]